MYQRTSLTLAALLLLTALPGVASAQDDEGYAWGEEGGGSTGSDAASGDDPLRIQLTLGAGIGARLLRNLDYKQEFLLPPYIDLGGAIFLPGTDLRHGIGLGLSTNVREDTINAAAFTQWSVTPSYHLLLPLQRLAGMDHDILQVQFRFAVPVVFTHQVRSGPNVTFGGELAAALHVKFLAGLGVYLEVQGALYGGYDFTVHPTVSADAGFLFDYEVLP